MLKTILSMLFGTLLMLLLTTWIYRKVRGGRDDGAAPAPALPPPDFQPPLAPIEMRLSADQVGASLSWSVGLLVLAGWLFTSAESGWLLWLAWPAGLLALLFAAWSLWDSWNEQGTRVVADATGLQLHERAAARAVVWSRVARVRMVELWASDNANDRGPKRLRSRQLLLLGAGDAELLTLRLPLRPAAASAAFLASVPVWTGRATEIEQRGR